MSKKAGPSLCLIVLLGAILLLALVVYLCLPYSPRTKGELYGTYVLDCKLVEEELILHDDGTFTQKATIKATSETASSKGNWTYKPSDGYVRLDEGFMDLLKWPDEVSPDYAHTQSTTAWLPAEYWFGRLELGGRVDSWPDWKKVK